MAVPDLFDPYAASQSTFPFIGGPVPTRRANAARMLLLFQVPLQLVNYALYLARLLFDPDLYARDTSTVLRAAARSGAWIQIFVLLACAVVFLNWERACYVRATAGVRDARFTPASAVVFWALPIFNWFVPFAALKHLWQLARGGVDWRSVAAPSYITAWWVSWPAWCVVAVATFLVTPATDHAQSPLPRVLLGSFSSAGVALSLAALLWAARFVREIDTLLRESSASSLKAST